MKEKPKAPRGKPLSLYPLTPDEALRRVFAAKPLPPESQKPVKKQKT